MPGQAFCDGLLRCLEGGDKGASMDSGAIKNLNHHPCLHIWTKTIGEWLNYAVRSHNSQSAFQPQVRLISSEFCTYIYSAGCVPEFTLGSGRGSPVCTLRALSYWALSWRFLSQPVPLFSFCERGDTFPWRNIFPCSLSHAWEKDTYRLVWTQLHLSDIGRPVQLFSFYFCWLYLGRTIWWYKPDLVHASDVLMWPAFLVPAFTVLEEWQAPFVSINVASVDPCSLMSIYILALYLGQNVHST